MKVLSIDIGNTRLKWTCSFNDKIIDRNLFAWQAKILKEDLEKQWGKLEQPEAILVSNVAGDVVRDILSEWCETNWQIKPTFAAVESVCCGVRNSYPEPAKLGVDRWLAMIAAWNLYNENVCVIDCGSAVTIDVVSANGQHEGGMISPGLALSGRALTDHTHALTAEQRKNFPLLANNTEDAINSGCYHHLIGGIQHVLHEIGSQFDPDMKYIITGGDAELVMTALDINMRHESDLVLNGLYLSFRKSRSGRRR